jgi:TRAP-type C4-dicarboxylate transport system permease small subunit
MGSNALNTAYNALLKVIKFLLAVFSAVLVVVVFTNVVSRYFLDFALAWAEETARFLLIWVTFLGAILVHDSNEHMGLEFVVQALPGKIRTVVLMIADIIIIAILAFIVKGGITITIDNLAWKSAALEIPYGLVYSIVPVSAFILTIQTVAKLFILGKELLESESNVSHNL